MSGLEVVQCYFKHGVEDMSRNEKLFHNFIPYEQAVAIFQRGK